jgi:hypothetical protein
MLKQQNEVDDETGGLLDSHPWPAEENFKIYLFNRKNSQELASF